MSLAAEFAKRVNGDPHFTIARVIWTDASGQERVMLAVNDFYTGSAWNKHQPALEWLRSQGVEVLGGRFQSQRDLHAEQHVRNFFVNGKGNLAPGTIVSVGVSNKICAERCWNMGILFEPDALLISLAQGSEMILLGR